MHILRSCRNSNSVREHDLYDRVDCGVRLTGASWLGLKKNRLETRGSELG
jgi:hypothetical protein